MTSPQTLADIAALLDLPHQVALLRKEVAELRTLLGEPRAKDKDLLTVEQAATYLGMTVAALRRATTRGSIPCIRVGRRVRYDKTELLESFR